MFLLKKFQKQNSEQFNNHNNNGQTLAKHGVQPMDQYLQRKFARGIQYNMKIIIRGDRNVGKTCLFYRLQGEKFHEEYIASEEIKVASIQWNYNATDDIVKVEIWDVVDKGKKRENLTSTIPNSKDVLKMHNNNANNSQQSSTNKSEISTNTITNNNTNDNTDDSSPALDAEFVDVYKGTNGVIFLFDITKPWTYNYVTKEIKNCPLNIPILILANHRDMGHHRAITAEQVHSFIDSLLQEDVELGRKRIGQIRYAESSMRNGFGLRYLYKFFNLPFLHLQRETILRQLERNAQEINATCQELDVMADSDEYNYDNFLEMITNKRRQVADQLSATKKVNQNNNIPPRSTSMPANMAAMGCEQNNRSNHSNNNNPNDSQIIKPMPSIIIGANNPLPPKFQQQFQKKSNKSAFFPQQANNPNSSSENTQSKFNCATMMVKNIDDFIPDDGEQNMFRKFLDEPNLPQSGDLPAAIDEEDSEEEDIVSNGFVLAKYQEELDPEDMIVEESTSKQYPNLTKSKSTDDCVKENNSEINSEPEDNQNEKVLEDNTKNNKVDSEEVQKNTEILPVLNCDEVEALESLYISKNLIAQNGYDNLDSSETIEESVPANNKSKKQSTTTNKSSAQDGSKKKKKKVINKTNNNTNDNNKFNSIIENDYTESTIQVNKKKKTGKLKTKNTTKPNIKSIVQDPMDDEDDDQRKLEEFLGTNINLDKHQESRDLDAYQML